MLTSLKRQLLGVASAVLVMGCGSDGGPTGPVHHTAVARVVLSASDSSALYLGQTRHFSVAAYTVDDSIAPNTPAPRFVSTNPGVATIDSTGVLTAGPGVGTAQIYGTVNNVRSPAIFVTVKGADFTILHVPPSVDTVSARDSVRIRITGADSVPLGQQSVTASIDGYSVGSSLATDDNGIITIPWTFPTYTEQSTMTISARGTVYTVSVVTTPGAPVRIALWPTFILLNGGSSYISAYVLDAYGNYRYDLTPSYTVRAPAAVTVGTDGVVTPGTAGQSFVVASIPGVPSDSAFVVTLPANQFAFTAPLPFEADVGSTQGTTIVLQGLHDVTRVGSVTTTLTWDPAVLALQGIYPSYNSIGTVALSADSAAGHATIVYADATGETFGVPLADVAFRVIGGSGTTTVVTATPTEAHAAGTYTDLMPAFLPTTYSMRIR